MKTWKIDSEGVSLHSAACKKCHKRYKMIIETLDSIITKYLKLDCVDLRYLSDFI